MVQTLEAIKGGGGSIKVGTTGTISALMSRELGSMKSSSQAPALRKSKTPADFSTGTQSNGGDTTPRKMKPRTITDEASSSGSRTISNNISHKSSGVVRKTKHNGRKTHQIPILDSENISIDGTPIRQKKGPYMVDIVDIKCGSPDRAWATPITNRLKKLGFSKLSESMI